MIPYPVLGEHGQPLPMLVVMPGSTRQVWPIRGEPKQRRVLNYCWWQPEIRVRKPVEGKVVYPIISLSTRVLAPSNRWLVFGMIFMTGARGLDRDDGC